MIRRFVPLAVVALTAAPLCAADPPSAAAIEFFETKIRPVLADHCFSCHGEKKQQAGLRLDTAGGMQKGSDDGPVVVPGDPAKSKLIKSVRREGDNPMPPKHPLAVEAVAALTEWVKLGAPYPAPAITKPDPLVAKSHWAFRLVKDPPVPMTKTAAGNPIDRFILAKLEARGLAMSPRADRRTVIRRAYFDLVGLPPTAEEVEAFEKDPSPDAWEKVIDRLLASPHYGERWGRHWLDVARYADSKGYVFTEERGYPYAYTYRDYVIRSFNEDKPFDRFVIEQIAADKLPPGPDNKPLAALGFLTVGRRFMNNVQDIIDDRIDVVTRGFMGLTMQCARCHDHKYDPVPMADYYSLYGVFASTVEPKELPLLSGNAKSPEVVAFEAELKRKQDAAADFAAAMYAKYLGKFRTREAVADYLLATRDARGKKPAEVEALALARKLEPVVLVKWLNYLADDERKSDPVFSAWLALAAMPDKDFAARVPVVLKWLVAVKPVHPRVAGALRTAMPKTIRGMAAAYGRVIASPDPVPDGQPILDVLGGPEGPTALTVQEADKFVPIAVKREYRTLRNAADRFRIDAPNAPPRAMAVADAPRATEPVIFLRGNPRNPGPAVPRRAPEVIAGNGRKPFADGSGRLELAKAIASPDNPLTARVFVNRVWAEHFGKGLVATTSDFGTRSDPPTHPELLDWLAMRFVEDGWSVKKLHKRIMLSAAYQQTSDIRAEHLASDPENRLLGRMNRRRLDFEALRDGVLAASGKLDRTLYGKSLDLFARPFSLRRSVYAAIDRQNLPGTFRVFDFASPDQHTPQRYVTTVPQQALFLMNSPFLLDQAKAVVARPDVAWAFTADEKAKRVYRTVLGRNPTADEVALAKEFVVSTGSWELFAQALLMSNEFAFVD